MKRLIFSIFLFALLCACAGPKGYWTKDINNPIQQKRDSFECERDATIVCSGSGWRPGSLMYQIEFQKAWMRCFESRGYYWVKE